MRAAIYSLPLFIQWIVGITWETSGFPLRAARRGLALFLIFLLVAALAFGAHGFVRYFSETANRISAYVYFGINAINSLTYLLLSLTLAFREWRRTADTENAPVRILDKITDRFEKAVSS